MPDAFAESTNTVRHPSWRVERMGSQVRLRLTEENRNDSLERFARVRNLSCVGPLENRKGWVSVVDAVP
jgi:hypothetical protein